MSNIKNFRDLCLWANRRKTPEQPRRISTHILIAGGIVILIVILYVLVAYNPENINVNDESDTSVESEEENETDNNITTPEQQT